MSTQQMAAGEFVSVTVDGRNLAGFLAGSALVQPIRQLLLGESKALLLPHLPPPITSLSLTFLSRSLSLGLKQNTSAVLILLHNDATVTISLPLHNADGE